MAICWPRELPQEVLRDPRKKAEVEVYHRLRDELEDEFHVYYSSPWLGIDHLGQEKDGECDFIVAHPVLGLLFIEVKGGGIDFDPHTGQWTSTDGHGFVHKIRDPVAQARSAKHELLRKLNLSRLWRARFIHATHGVIFPKAASPPDDLGADRPAIIFCCSRELQTGLRSWIGHRMGEAGAAARCHPLDLDGLAALDDLVARPLSLHFTLGARINEAEDALKALTPRQYQIIDLMAEIERTEVRGGAGTGKTVIAMEEALRAAVSGKRTLLTCKSRPLARRMRRELGDQAELEVRHFHSLCSWLAGTTWITLPECSDEQELFDRNFPAAMIEALGKRPDLRWEHVVVDEGQDFRTGWWAAIEAAIAPRGRLRVFSDSNQTVYGSTHCPPELTVIPIRLSHNLRNTVVIHEAASVHYSGHAIEPHGPPGDPVRWIEIGSDAGVVPEVTRRVRALLTQEEVDPSHIAVLFPRRAQVESCRNSLGGDLPISDCEADDENVFVDTVHRFKGLERPVVLLGLPRSAAGQDELAYVALSRGRSHLEVFGTAQALEWIRGGGLP